MKATHPASPPPSSDLEELSVQRRTGALSCHEAASIQPFSGFGSFRQRHGDVLASRRGRSLEAPAKLESLPAGKSLPSQLFHLDFHRTIPPPLHGNADAVSSPLYCEQRSASSIGLSLDHQRRLVMPQQKQMQRPFPADLDREEAWERKKGLNLQEQDEHTDSSDDDGYDGSEEEEPVFVDDDVASDPGAAAWKLESGSRRRAWQRRRSARRLLRSRARSLADEDLEELRGSIDLGFGFGSEESSSNLRNTLPALGLYYAINRNYLDSKCRSSPVSPLDANTLVRTQSAGSTGSPSSESWRISSPGDPPNEVKSRLRHWAQAVACSIKQAY